MKFAWEFTDFIDVYEIQMTSTIHTKGFQMTNRFQ